MTARIVLLGATGYTGRRTAQAMVRRGLRPVLAGRSAARLASLAGRLGQLDVAPADVGDAASVRALIEPGDVLVSTVGPFRWLGEAALRATIDAAAIYLDSTGEPSFIRRVFEEFGPLAEQTGASLVTAFGYDYVPGNLAGALALRSAGGAVHRVEVGYLITGVGRAQVISRGTFASLVATATEPAFVWRGGIRAEPTGSRMRTFSVGGRDRPAWTIGSTEHYALPQLTDRGLAEVDVYLGWSESATRAAQLSSRIAPVLLRLPGARLLVGEVGKLAVRWVAPEPDPAALARVVPHFIAIAYDASGVELAQVHLVSGEPYQLTADLLAWAAQRAADHGVSRSGALGPVDAFGLDGLAAGAVEIGLHRCG
ncbi:MAG: saccharopine dehydrogenase family protein [Pseudonocardiaceae bacterium]